MHTHKAKFSAATKWPYLPSKPVMGYLCATLVLRVRTGWSRTGNLQEAIPYLTDKATKASPGLYPLCLFLQMVMYPLMLQLGGLHAFPVGIRPPGPSWVSEQNFLLKEAAITPTWKSGNQTWDLSDIWPTHLAILPHTHT